MDGFTIIRQVLPALTLIVGGLVLVRWWMTRGGVRRSGPSLRVLSRTSLSRNGVIAVVDIDGRRFLVGSGEQGTNLLAELEPGTDAEAAVDAADLPDRRSPGWDRPAPGPRNGLLDRLRAMTVRSPVARPPRAVELLRR